MSPERTIHGSLVPTEETRQESERTLKQKLCAIVCDKALPKSVRDVARDEWLTLIRKRLNLKCPITK